MKNYNFGHLLKVTRLRLGLEQREFARMLDISQSTYSRYEKGRTDPPLSLVVKLTDKYNFPTYLLFYPDLDEFVLNLPLYLISFYLFENHYDYNPLRIKSTKRKNDDMLELFSGLVSTIGQIKLRYNSYNLQTFINYLVIHEYDIEKIERMISPIKNAYKIE
jgi:transcriptional regulator with XRE-family HTH domain